MVLRIERKKIDLCFYLEMERGRVYRAVEVGQFCKTRHVDERGPLARFALMYENSQVQGFF